MNISLERKFKRDSHGKCPSNLISMLSTEVFFFPPQFNATPLFIPLHPRAENLTKRWDFLISVSRATGRIGGKVLFSTVLSRVNAIPTTLESFSIPCPVFIHRHLARNLPISRLTLPLPSPPLPFPLSPARVHPN